MIAVLQNGGAVNRPHGFSGIFAWLSANIEHPDRKETCFSTPACSLMDSAEEPGTITPASDI
jgi:hypothetical protein